jgi:hypothetical protein
MLPRLVHRRSACRNAALMLRAIIRADVNRVTSAILPGCYITDTRDLHDLATLAPISERKKRCRKWRIEPGRRHMADVTPDPITGIALGFMAAKHLFVASAIGLFERLASGAATLDEHATKCGVPRRTLGISIDAMASLGLVERDGECYRNSAAAAAFLAGTPGPDLRPMLRFLDRISYGLWMNLEAAVRAGEGQRQFGGFSAEQQQIFSAGVEAFSAASVVALAANYDFGRHRRVLDVAGGTGSFLIPILRRYPALQATLFELPGACAVARPCLA